MGEPAVGEPAVGEPAVGEPAPGVRVELRLAFIGSGIGGRPAISDRRFLASFQASSFEGAPLSLSLFLPLVLFIY